MVKETFYAHNDPIGLMLRITPEMSVGTVDGYQYILFENFTPDTAAAWLQGKNFTGICIAAAEDTLEGWEAVVQGVCTADANLALQARNLGMLVLAKREGLKADGYFWPVGTEPGAIASRSEDSAWDEAYIAMRCAHAEGEELLGAMAVLAALRSHAKAILILSTDGSNLSSVSSLYPPIPVIAIAKRPEREAMLLCQTMRWATLPTAITRTPESMDVEAFARFVAELYGYQKGDSFIALGHWVEGQNRQQMCCFTL